MGLFDFLGGKAPNIPAPTDIFAKKAIKGKKGKNKGKVIGREPSLAEKSVGNVAGYYESALPSTLALSSKYSPEFLRQGFEFGGQAYEGLAALQRKASEDAARQMADLRSQELGTMTGQAGQTRGLLESLSPEQAGEVARMQRLAQLGENEIGAYGQRSQGFLDKYGIGTQATDTASQMAQQMAQESFARRGTLSPEEQRASQQAAREAGLASGRIGGTSAIAAEIQNREAAMAARRAEAAQMAGQSSMLGRQAAEQRMAGFGQLQDIERMRANLREMAGAESGRAFGAAGSFYTAPGLELLSRTPASYGAGTSLATAGLGLGRELGPQLDYNLGLNLARERASALDASNLAKYQADAQASQARTGMLGSLAGLAAIPFTGGLSAGLGLTGLAGGAAGASGLSGLGLSAGMGLSSLFGGGPPRATPVY